MGSDIIDKVIKGYRGLIQRLLSLKILRHMRLRRLQNLDVTISDGIAAGIRFNAGSSNPEYSLGINEPPVQEAFARYLHKGDVLYDVGANVGFFTVIGAMLIGPSGQVHAFEPVLENAAMIRHNCELNGIEQVTVWDTAVSDKSGFGNLQLAHYSGGAALSVSAPPPDFKGIIQVGLITLDDFSNKNGVLPPSMVKIDVEGAEIHVLRGMVGTIKKHKPIIIFEIDDEKEDSFHKKKAICTDFLQNLDYKIEILPDSYPHADWIVENYIALPS